MPQMLIHVSGMKHKTDGDRLVAKGETVTGVRMVKYIGAFDKSRLAVVPASGSI